MSLCNLGEEGVGGGGGHELLTRKWLRYRGGREVGGSTHFLVM